MINEYFTQILYRHRGLDWFSETQEVSRDDDIPFDLKVRATEKPYDAEFIYQKNAIFLESVNADEFCRRGVYTATFGFFSAMIAILMGVAFIYSIRNIFVFKVGFFLF